MYVCAPRPIGWTYSIRIQCSRVWCPVKRISFLAPNMGGGGLAMGPKTQNGDFVDNGSYDLLLGFNGLWESFS